MRDFVVTAHSDGLVWIEVTVRTWAGDGLDVWRSLERDLTLSAEHTGSCVRNLAIEVRSFRLALSGTYSWFSGAVVKSCGSSDA
jgi:hypothetical protein